MKKVNPKKLLPAPVAKNQASFSQKFLVPASRVTVNDSAKVKDTVSTPQQKDLKEQSLSLKRKFISLTKLFGIKTNLERKKNKQKRVELENERRQKSICTVDPHRARACGTSRYRDRSVTLSRYRDGQLLSVYLYMICTIRIGL